MSLANVKLKRLRKVRESRAMTQEQLGESASVSANTISSTERGLPVKHSTAERLAKALGVTVEALS